MKALAQGMRDGLPIGAGYFAVAFSLGIIATKAGIPAWQGFVSSLSIRASAGEYALYTSMAAGAALVEVFVLGIIANLRYLLMGTAMVQRFAPGTPLWQRILACFCITDEVFGISIAHKAPLPPAYTIGAMVVSGLMWAAGTTCGICAGDVMPKCVVSALGVALYGMFIAIIVAPAKKDKAVLAAVAVSFALSSLCAVLPVVSHVSPGTRTVLLTILISAAAAIIKPATDEE